MNKELIVRNSIQINAPVARVWDALTNPEQTKKYMYGCEALSDWKPGSPLIWKGIFDGKELVAVKGNIVDIRENEYLAYTTIDPNMGLEDIPENYATVTYTLADNNGKTNLTVTQGDFAKLANGQQRYEDATREGGWGPLLEEIKKLVEAS
ncbi:SRPBCC family protein [Ohtaekwangia sp.]|uniref:SRPBCC family protein n=1 Tax=Ohtaekwangia sp. TaxID=2066019 RepID=UPI002FDDE9F7